MQLTEGPPEVSTEFAAKFLQLDPLSTDTYGVRDQLRKLREAINAQSDILGSDSVVVGELSSIRSYLQAILERKEVEKNTGAKKKTFRKLLETKLNLKQDSIKFLTNQAKVDATYPILVDNDVRAIVDYLIPLNAEQRLAPIFLMDSIFKNIGNLFIEKFVPHIEGILVKTYKYGKDETRQRITTIVREWTKHGFFPLPLMKNIKMGISSMKRISTKPPEPEPMPMGMRPIIPPGGGAIVNVPRNGPINVHLMISQLESHLVMRPDLGVMLSHIKERSSRGLDITEEVFQFNARLARPAPQIHRERAPGSRNTTTQSVKRKYQGRESQSNRPRKKRTKAERETIWAHDDGSMTFFALFDLADIKRPHKRSLDLLYSDKLELCPTCGLRLKKQDINEHLDNHFKENNEKKLREKQARVRVWYLSTEDWLQDASASKKPDSLFFSKKAEKQRANKKVLADDDFTDCQICGEDFKKIFDQGKDDWVYVGCIYADGRTSKSSRNKGIVHQRCFEDLIALDEKKSPALPPPPMHVQNPDSPDIEFTSPSESQSDS